METMDEPKIRSRTDVLRGLENNTSKVIEYHDLSKHSYYRNAPSLGYMDWATQPDPFRRFIGSKSVFLERSFQDNGPSFDKALIEGTIPIYEFNKESLSRFFFNSLAISAWKSIQGSTWALRVNPSSGNLHPTESYLISGPNKGLFDQPVVCHYLSENHSLELRAEIPESVWKKFIEGFPEDVFFIGLSSIYWREAWKYGERAFRYCNHDVGHAIGAISIAASELGWEAQLIEDTYFEDLQTLLGLKNIQLSNETEDADCLIAIYKRKPEKNQHTYKIKNFSEVASFF